MANWYVWTRAVFAAFGGFMFGYDAGAINGVKDMVDFRETFNIENGNINSSSCNDDNVQDSAILGLLVSIFSIGGLIGALLAGTLSDLVGRKPAIITGGVVVTIGGALQSGAYHIWMVFLGRFIAGFGVGILYTVVPAYVAELSPKRLRGRLVSFFAIFLTAGVLTAIVVNYGLEKVAFGWRISLGLLCLFSMILVIGMLFLPESPRWLVKKHKDEKAGKILARCHQKKPAESIQEELREIQTAVRGGGFMQTLKLFFTWKTIHKVLIGMCLLLLNRIVGLPMITYYSVSIFCKIGVPGHLGSVLFGLVFFTTTILTTFLVDRVGRKPLLLVGAVKMTVTLLLAATLLLEFRVEEGENKGVGYFVVVLILMFVFSYAYTFGPVTWIVNSELHSMKVKAIAGSLTTSAFWIGNIMISLIPPVLLASPLQTHGTLYILAGVNLVAFLFVLLTLPETKAASLEKVDELFRKPWLERTRILYYLRCGCIRCYRRVRWQPSETQKYSEVQMDQILVQNDSLNSSTSSPGNVIELTPME